MATAQGQTASDDVSDLAVLWNDAVATFKEKTGQDLKFPPYKNMGDALKAADIRAERFKEFRHDKGKTDKVRSAFSANLTVIDRIAGGVHTVARTTSAFPPAIPADALMSAFTFVIQVSLICDVCCGEYL